ncbi:uncharacterized protein LOC124943458 [Impatiens glandulifera]|uniref:uncharacterized protein LOC124943458 n=1 Tax=Impatiens glandulifera TaxID=253017 RepID=UPI001FB0536B|nr:uncharacterized protein LOC124943458 [Impatiens glandulifera]
MDEIHQQACAASEVFYQWVRYRHRILYKNMLLDLTVSQKFEKLVEMEEEVISLTKTQDVTTALRRNRMVEPHARLQRLIEHIQRLQEKHIPGTPDSSLELLVLNLLVVKERDLTEEIARLEAEPDHQETSNLSRSPPEDVGVRKSTPLTDQRASVQTGDSEPDITEERVKAVIEEFVNDAVQPWKKKIKETADKAIEMAETTKDDLNKAVDRITSVETNYGNTDQLYDGHIDRTKALEDITSKLVTDLASVSQMVAMMERSQETTDQRLTKVDEDLARSAAQTGSTLERVAKLIAAKLATDKALEEANALAAQKLQDALDEQTRIQKETAATDANIAGHLQNIENSAPAIAASITTQQAKDATRLKVQQETYNKFAKAHKKSKAVASPSVPITRKRKAAEKRAEIATLLGRVTDTVVEPQFNPALQADDDFEEELDPQFRRQKGFDAVPIRSIAQPISPFTDNLGGQRSSSRPVPVVKGKTTDELLEHFLPPKSKK